MAVLGIGGLFFRALDPEALSAGPRRRRHRDRHQTRIHDPEGNAIELWEPPS
jgi:hypothetical protein